MTRKMIPSANQVITFIELFTIAGIAASSIPQTPDNLVSNQENHCGRTLENCSNCTSRRLPIQYRKHPIAANNVSNSTPPIHTASEENLQFFPLKIFCSRYLIDGLSHNAAPYAHKKGTTRGSRYRNPKYTAPVIPNINKIFFSFLIGLSMVSPAF